MKSHTNNSNLQTAYKLICVLATIIVVLGIALVWNWQRNASISSAAYEPLRIQFSELSVNLIRKKYPDVDFSRFYPGLSDGEIDAIQRETFSVRLGYEPFVQFHHVPIRLKHVTISPFGFRHGESEPPWPPSENEFSIFVYGGSTTFGYGLPDHQTVVAALERRLQRTLPTGRRVRCYNFGRGYFFSTQERALLERHLLSGVVPDYAVFIDGLNDFLRYDGRPQLTQEIQNYVTADLPFKELPVPPTVNGKIQFAVAVLNRIRSNLRIVESLGNEFGFQCLFIGQPVPLYYYPWKEKPELFPFGDPDKYDPILWTGYPEYRHRVRSGKLGENYLWLGNLFENASEPKYVDMAHYTARACDEIAEGIGERIIENSSFKQFQSER